jgi:Mn2+/Fe2+ NRAMP family transporter
MTKRVKLDWKPDHSLLLAQTACLCLGTGIVLWGLAPAIVQRLLTGQPPSLATLLPAALALPLGGAFIGMCVLVRRRVRWATWTAFLLSALLAAIGLALTTLAGVRLTSSFVILLSAGTCLATWLALATLAQESSQAAAKAVAEADPSTHRVRY